VNQAPVIGVLALQGDVAEHVRMLKSCGAASKLIKSASHLEGLDGLVIPGGESTTIGLLARREGLLEPLREAIKGGLPTLGTCAGLIFLAKDVTGGRPDQEFLGVLDVTVRRNAFGRQVDSFEQQIEISGWPKPFPAIFIRAPWVEATGSGVEALAVVHHRSQSDEAHGHAAQSKPQAISSDGRERKIVMVKQANVVATAFHPELTADSRVHSMICEMAVTSSTGGA
jgi:5'-phosphate synthase pdxT subunit